MLVNRIVLILMVLFVSSVLGEVGSSFADQTNAFKINGKKYRVIDIMKEEEASFYEIEKQKYEIIERMAKEKYLEIFFTKLAKDQKKSVQVARKNYMEQNVKISDSEIKNTLKKYKDYPQLKKLSAAEQRVQIRGFLQGSKSQAVIAGIIKAGMDKKKLVISYPKPSAPIYKVVANSNDPMRFGPNAGDISSSSKVCNKKKCPITVIEYSEFQCPYCVRVLPTVKRLMTEYKGKVRWIVRDFPLSFHDRARPAAIAAHCAKKQGHYWTMYNALFADQRDLSDKKIMSHAKDMKGLNFAKWQSCITKPGPINAQIDKNFQSGQKFGVTGTPAFFINGRRISGAQPYDKFKEIFDDELNNGRKS
jgi:protein-disulfide isomerase